MNKKIFIALLMLGLLASSHCQSTTDGGNDNQGGNGNQGGGNGTTNGTTGNETLNFGDFFMWQDQYVQVLQASATPSGVADDISAFFSELSNMTANLNSIAVMMVDKNVTMGQIENAANLSALWNDLLAHEGEVYAIVSSQLQNLEFAKGRLDCFSRFNFADLEAYVGIQALTKYFFNNDSATDDAYLQNLTFFCNTEYDRAQAGLNDLINILLGQDDQCDLLQDMYDGYLPLQLWTGWREFIANAYGYILLDVQWSQMVQSACLSLSGVADAAANVTSVYQDQVKSLVDRYIQYQQQAIFNQGQTVFLNLQGVLDMYENLSPYVATVNIDYVIPYLYPNYDWILITFSSNATSNDYAISCWHCVTLFQQNGLNVVAAWVQKNTTSSLTAGGFDSIGQNSTDTSALQLVSDIYDANNCTSGVVVLNKDVDQFVIQYLGDRYKKFNVSDNNIYVWGIEEECLGEPNV